MKNDRTLINKCCKTSTNLRVFRILSCVFAVSILLLGALFTERERDVVSGQTQQILKNPTELKSQRNTKRGGDLNFDLNINYAENKIFNPSSGKYDNVKLRSYNGGLVGPTMHVKPGQLLRINLMNNLPADDPSCQANENMDIPHCFNSTNLHTHGWHVSPTGNSDNVLLDIKPQTNLDYEFYLPKDHPAGTFWYHSHRHGSTALQVSSGMAGTLIVEGFRELKDKTINGIADIDTILKDVKGNRFEDRIFMFEQIAYACLDDNGNISTQPTPNPAPDPPVKQPWICSDKQVGGIEQYGEQFGPGTWGPSGRFTMINGTLQPLFETRTGKIERWRLIHGGVRDTINFRIIRSGFKATTPAEMDEILKKIRLKPPDEQKELLREFCKAGQDFDYNQSEFAVDGLTRKRMSNKKMNILQPGYRSDILVAFDRPGIYCVVDEATPPAESLFTPELQANKMLLSIPKSADLNDTQLLSMVFVSGGTPFKEEPQQYIAKQLVAANQDLPNQVKDDLSRLYIPEFVPHPDIEENELNTKKHQELAFAIRTASDNSTLFQIANKINPQPSDYFSYDASRIDRILPLGGVDEWQLTSRFISHPFHIHVNPFQIIDILKPDGSSIIKDGRCVDKFPSDTGTFDPQYCDQIGVWRDSLFIKQNPNFDSSGNSQGYVIKIRTRYERYIGDFVLHCHILDHEDQGMMQNIRIAPEGGYIEGEPSPTKGGMNHDH